MTYDYSDITIIIKTFIRPKVCVKTVRAWNNLYPDIPIIVIDDGDISPDLSEYKNVRHIKTEFNIGLSAGRNLGLKNSDTNFVFIADDDDLPTQQHKLMDCKNILINNDIDILGHKAFSINNKSNHNILVQELYISNDYLLCDVTTNHFLAKNRNLPYWPESIKIKREHMIFFQRCKEKNLKIAGTNLLQFVSQRKYPPRYSSFKNKSTEYDKIMKENFGINNVVWKYLKGKNIIE